MARKFSRYTFSDTKTDGGHNSRGTDEGDIKDTTKFFKKRMCINETHGINVIYIMSATEKLNASLLGVGTTVVRLERNPWSMIA